jgi:hypothetical protein
MNLKCDSSVEGGSIRPEEGLKSEAWAKARDKALRHKAPQEGKG